MTYWFEAFGFTIDARGWARAGEAGSVGVGIGALKAMVFGQVVAAAEGADDGILQTTAVLHVVAERMAAVTLFDEGKGVKKFDDTRAAKKENGSGKKAFKPGPIFI